MCDSHPIQLTEVFNEWGAVLKHQDEIEEQGRKDELSKQRERQVRYRAELDNQVLLHQDKQLYSKIQD
jgi:hypothetical protein